MMEPRPPPGGAGRRAAPSALAVALLLALASARAAGHRDELTAPAGDGTAAGARQTTTAATSHLLVCRTPHSAGAGAGVEAGAWHGCRCLPC